MIPMQSAQFKQKRGGARDGAGRPRSLTSLVNTKASLSIRLTPVQREKLRKLGAAKWIREKIDAELLEHDPAQDRASGSIT